VQSEGPKVSDERHAVFRAAPGRAIPPIHRGCDFHGHPPRPEREIIAGAMKELVGTLLQKRPAGYDARASQVRTYVEDLAKEQACSNHEQAARLQQQHQGPHSAQVSSPPENAVPTGPPGHDHLWVDKLRAS